MSYSRFFSAVGGLASGETQNADTSSTDRCTTTRNVLVHISGNRVTWEHLGVHGAVWRVNSEHANSIFGSNDVATPPSSSDTPDADDRLSRAMIKRICLLESHTNVDDAVGISIDGIPPLEYTANGMGVSCFLTGSGKVTEPRELFCIAGNTELGMAWMQQYPKYTSDNLEIEGTMFLTGATYYFVHEGHPVIQMLRTSQDDMGLQLANDPTDDGGWYKIDVETFLLCVKTLREGVLQHTPSTFNLSSLTVRLCKPDRQSWLHMSAQLIDQLVFDKTGDTPEAQVDYQAIKKSLIQRYIERPVFVTLRLSIEYTLPDQVKCAASDPPKAVPAALIPQQVPQQQQQRAR